MNDGIRVNPPRTTVSISQHITSLKSGTEMRRIGFGWNSGGSILPRNIWSFNLINIKTPDLSDRSAAWHQTEKVKVKP